ncbi:MAG TPA: hypothetical protein VGL72_21845 [Bryobacteraceae bacterium]
MATIQSSGRIAGGCLALFSLPFIAMGGFFAIVSYRSLDNPNFKNPWIGVFMGSGFALIGIIMLLAGLVGTRKQRALLATQQTYPDQPWMWRADWAQGRADGMGGGSAANSWIFAIGWNGISWSIGYMMWTHPDPHRPIWAGLMIGLFCAIGVGVAGIAVIQALRYARFGKTSLALQSVPAPLGRKLKGTIDVHMPSPLPHGINVSFACVNRVTTGSGNNRSTSDHIRWQEKKTLGPEQIMTGQNGSTIPVDFDVPRDMQPTDHSHPDNQILWLLRAEADIPGANFDDHYEVPVFATRESPSLQDWQAQQNNEERAHPATTPVRPTVRVTPAPDGGMQFYFPAGRNVNAAWWLTVFTGIFGGASYVLFRSNAPIFFAILFTFFSVPLLLITLNLWFGIARIVANSNGIMLSSSTLGIGGTQRWTPQEIQRIYPKITMQSGGSEGVVYYTVTLTDSAGRECQLGNSLRDHNEAEWVCEQIRNLAGVNAKAVGAS